MCHFVSLIEFEHKWRGGGYVSGSVEDEWPGKVLIIKQCDVQLFNNLVLQALPCPVGEYVYSLIKSFPRRGG